MVRDVRDAKEALRRQVDVLEDTLAEKEAEIARLKADKSGEKPVKGSPKEKKKKKPPSQSTEPVEIRFGTQRADGSIRYVVRPIEWMWVAILGAVSLGFIVFISMSAVKIPWAALFVWVPIPLLTTFRAGFDIRPAAREVRVWQSLGPVDYSSHLIQRSIVPEARAVMESAGDSNRKTRVTYLYWGSRFIRATLPRKQLDELVTEVRALVVQASE